MTDPIVSIKHCHKTYKKDQSKVHALKDVNLEIQRGDFFALLGENGAGKSTLLGILSNLIRPTSGEIIIDGKDLLRQAELVKQVIGIIPQEINLNYFEKVRDVLIQQAGYYGVPIITAKHRMHKLLTQLSLLDKASNQVMELSGGMKRRLLIARALTHNPKILLLDEPTAGLDIQLRRQLWQFLIALNQEQKITIILTTHNLEEAERLCKNLAIINKGKIIEQGSIKNLIQKLKRERFIIGLQKDLEFSDFQEKIARDSELREYSIQYIDTTTLSLELTEKQSLNQFFMTLQKHVIHVKSVRNESNRLEEYFFERLNNKNQK